MGAYHAGASHQGAYYAFLQLVERVGDLEWASFHRYVRMGYYEADWGGAVGKELEGMRCGE